MGNSLKIVEYYNRVRDAERLIAHLILNGGDAHAHQPEPIPTVDRITGEVTKSLAAVYITSLDDPDHGGIVAGVVCGAPLKLAAQAIARRSHRLATREEVTTWRQAGIDRKKATDLEDARLQGKNASFVVTVPPPTAADPVPAKKAA
jgi:hypothetical protein